MTQLRPDVNTHVNTNTERTGLPSQDFHVLFVTDDHSVNNSMPLTTLYNKTQADQQFGKNSKMGAMLDIALQRNAAIKTTGFTEGLTAGCMADAVIFKPNFHMQNNVLKVSMLCEISTKDFTKVLKFVAGVAEGTTLVDVVNRLFFNETGLSNRTLFNQRFEILVNNSKKNVFAEGDEIMIRGNSDNVPDGIIEASTIKFLFNDSLEEAEVDFNKAQWLGTEAIAHSCAVIKY